MSAASFSDAIGEVAKLLEECSRDAAFLETSLSDWLANGAEVSEFPVVELQRLDLLQQVQHDLVTVLSSPDLTAGFDGESIQVRVDALSEAPKLEQIRDRFRRLKNGGNTGVNSPVKDLNREEDNGEVDLF